jgi:hypothetical protein
MPGLHLQHGAVEEQSPEGSSAGLLANGSQLFNTLLIK